MVTVEISSVRKKIRGEFCSTIKASDAEITASSAFIQAVRIRERIRSSAQIFARFGREIPGYTCPHRRGPNRRSQTRTSRQRFAYMGDAQDGTKAVKVLFTLHRIRA